MISNNDTNTIDRALDFLVCHLSNPFFLRVRGAKAMLHALDVIFLQNVDVPRAGPPHTGSYYLTSVLGALICQSCLLYSSSSCSSFYHGGTPNEIIGCNNYQTSNHEATNPKLQASPQPQPPTPSCTKRPTFPNRPSSPEALKYKPDIPQIDPRSRNPSNTKLQTHREDPKCRSPAK